MDQLIAPSTRREGPVVQDEHESRRRPPRGSRSTASDTPDGVVQPAIGQGEEEVERDRGHHEGGQRGDVPRAARRMHASPPCGRPSAPRPPPARRSRPEDGRGTPSTRCAPARGCRRTRRAPRRGSGRTPPQSTGAIPPGHRDPPADHDARDRQPEEEDLEQPERAEDGRRRVPARRRRARSPTSICTSSRTVIGLRPLGLDGRRGSPTPRPRRSSRPACGRSAPRPTRRRRRG